MSPTACYILLAKLLRFSAFTESSRSYMGSKGRNHRRSFLAASCRALSLFLLLTAMTGFSQQTPGAQEPRTGRSYESGNPSTKPPRPAPHAPSPVTLTHVPAQTPIASQHPPSPPPHNSPL